MALSNKAFQYFLDQYDKKYCNQMIRYCANGRSPESFAGHINVTPEVFAYWAHANVEFEISLHIAFWKSYEWWEQEMAHNFERSPAVYKLVMQHRFKWREDGQDLQKLVRNMNTEDLEVMARRMLENMAQAPKDINYDVGSDDEEF